MKGKRYVALGHEIEDPKSLNNEDNNEDVNEHEV
jgi:hypothetical protein